jgi:threonine/homoserine/homoserine lactone efflux protein
MDPLRLVALTVAISASGALSPGPLSAAAMINGARWSWRAGLRMAAGHMTFELPFVVAIGMAAYELRWALGLPAVRYGLGALMGAFIAYFSATTILDGLRYLRGRQAAQVDPPASGPYFSGLALTALNPFFLLWWLTVGMALVELASAMGLLLGYAVMYPSHVWMDFAWLTLLSSLGHQGRRLSGRGYGALLVALAAVMAVAGAYALSALL